jgi:hypothetical protein
MPTDTRHVISVSMYGDKHSKTLIHTVRDALAALTGRRWSLTETMRYCVEQQCAVLIDQLAQELRARSPSDDIDIAQKSSEGH